MRLRICHDELLGDLRHPLIDFPDFLGLHLDVVNGGRPLVQALL